MVDIEELAKLLLGMAAVGNAAAAIIKALDHWRERRRRRTTLPAVMLNGYTNKHRRFLKRRPTTWYRRLTLSGV